MLLDGQGHTIRQTCSEERGLRQDSTGFLLKDVKLTRGGSDGPGAALTSRGEIKIVGVQRGRERAGHRRMMAVRRAGGRAPFRAMRAGNGNE
jgi:hypothetical protein